MARTKLKGKSNSTDEEQNPNRKPKEKQNGNQVFAAYACPHCDEKFSKWTQCQAHLLETDHLGPLRSQYGVQTKEWPSAVHSRCQNHAVTLRVKSKKNMCEHKDADVANAPSLYDVFEGLQAESSKANNDPGHQTVCNLRMRKREMTCRKREMTYRKRRDDIP
jgi:hypothetical protein